MSWRAKFNRVLEVDWISVDDAMPLAEYGPGGESESWGGGIVDDFFVLILDDDDPNDDPSIVQIEYLMDHDKVGSWCWGGGAPYPECHANNIKFWAEVPNYCRKSMPL